MLGIIFLAGTNFFKVKIPVYVGDRYDGIKDLAGKSDDTILEEALFIGLGYVALALISGVFLFLTRQTIIIMSRLIEYDLKNEIYLQYQRLDYTFRTKQSTGDLMNRISEDVTYTRMYLGPAAMYSISLVILFIFAIVEMVQIDGTLTLFVLLPLPLMSFLVYKVSSKMNYLSRVVQSEQSNMSTLVQEYFSGIRVLKAYGGQKIVKEKFDESSDSYLNKNMRLVMVNALFLPTIFVLIGLSTLLVIYLGGIFHFSDPEGLTNGDIIKYIMFVNMLTWPFASIGWVTSLVQRAAASQERINEFLDVKPEIVNTNEQPFSFDGKIEFKNVSFTYPEAEIPAINNLSFTLNAGDTFGIVGRTGSGKSTILKLLTRQIDPSEGEILIDGISLKDINLDAFRADMGIVPQDVFLFSDTIANNLRFGSLIEVDHERLVEVTQKAYVYHNIDEFPNKFETLLGERGVNLSGGQKQRVSIARALIRNPKLLILDDCLSAVDTKTEEIILENLRDENIKTSVVVSHRISSIRNANYIINIDQGTKTEEGTHKELIAANGAYAEMYRKQLEEQSEE
ncbi:MAG: ABC transporter ATP-binding protein [Crocinitomicaceae bacterium]|nr:ABC transporter ATP-binding protein [Crocinitomicaceae bacterium]